MKDPELLVLDEPLHGLDDGNRQRVKDIIETFCGAKQNPDNGYALYGGASTMH